MSRPDARLSATGPQAAPAALRAGPPQAPVPRSTQGPQPAKAPRLLARLARRPARPFRLRLVDAVVLAAAGLLVLKLTALVQGEARSGPPPLGTPLPEFARALANARTGYEPKDPSTTGSLESEAARKPAPAEGPPPDAQSLPPPPSIAEPASAGERAILEKLAARRESLRQRSEALDLRERLLNEVEGKLEAGVSDLKETEARVEGGSGRQAEAQKAALKGIVTMYETMKPKDAGRVFDRLGLDVLVPIVLGMNPRKAAEVLAVMQPEAAERLTVALAHRARGTEAPPPKTAAAGLPANELPAIDQGPPAR